MIKNKYEQKYWIINGNITCTCKHGSLFPLNFLKGEKVCRHIKEYIKNKKGGKK